MPLFLNRSAFSADNYDGTSLPSFFISEVIMLKGVNRKIIEVNRPDSIYFEKAVFYLRPNVRELPQEISDAEISRYIDRLGIEYRRRKRSLMIGKIIFSTLLLICIAALTAVYMMR